MSGAIGRTLWVIAGGRIPFPTTGAEPQMTSRDELRFLNTGDTAAEVQLTIVYSDRNEIGSYRLRVAAQRFRRARVNDLIDPLPVPLETAYAIVIRATTPIVVQFTRLDSSSATNAIMGTIAHGC